MILDDRVVGFCLSTPLIASYRRLRAALPGDAAVGGHASHAARAGSGPKTESRSCWSLEKSKSLIDVVLKRPQRIY